MAVGVFSWSTTTSARALAACALRTASASGRFAETGIARLASFLALTDGSRSLILAALIAWVDWNQMKPAMISSHSQLRLRNEPDDSRWVISARPTRIRESTRPAQAAA